MDNPKAIINLENISHNVSQIKKTVNTSKILAVIKADAYGHGASKIATHLESNPAISAYGVSRYSEAKRLFDAGVKKPILLMEGVISFEQLISAVEHQFWLVVQDYEQLDLINKLFNQSQSLSNIAPLNIWLKFDSGMHRLGIPIDDQIIKQVLILIYQLIEKNVVNSRVIIMSHLACADDLKHSLNYLQLEKFNDLMQHCKIFEQDKNIIFEYSLANSAGIFGWPSSFFDWVRPGISLYGSSPIVGKTSHQLNLKPSMKLLSKVIALKAIKSGDSVGYGASWLATKATKLGIIASGYADCYPRTPSEHAVVWLNNKKCSILGRVSMDMLAIDCSDLADNEIAIGNNVELWGNHITIDEAAHACNTVSYELYTRITSRVEKVYI